MVGGGTASAWVDLEGVDTLALAVAAGDAACDAACDEAI